MTRFTSRAGGRGGREGRVWSERGSYEHEVVLPGSRAAGVTPEELLAGAWAACFGGALGLVAAEGGIDAAAAEFHVAVTLDSDLPSRRFEIDTVRLEVELDGVDPARLDELIAAAHEICPVSKLFAGGARAVEVARFDSAATQAKES